MIKNFNFFAFFMPNLNTIRCYYRNNYTKVETKVEQAAQIFDDYAAEIYSIILFNVNDSSIADDIFQDLFLTFIQKPIPSNTRNIKAYIFKTITNDISDTVRQAKNYHQRLTRYAEGKKHLMITGNPEDTAIQAEQMRKLFDLIEKQLPPRQAQAIFLRYMDNRSTTEAAKKMGVSKTTISKYVWLGLKKIQQLFARSKVEANAY